MKYDPFQQRAIEHIKQGQSVIVSAPTGSGKTVIAEHVIEECLRNSSKAVYTAPIKALSNQKFRDFQIDYYDKIGILTGDVSINPSAQILIMTTEIFRNKILSGGESLEEYSWVIFDEIHYLDNYERGTVWEESLIFLPSHMNILALSATIPNINEFSDWIRSIHKKDVKVITESTRPVPLHMYYQCHGKIIGCSDELRSEFPKKQNRRDHRRGRSYNERHSRPNRLFPLIKDLRDKDRLPCIFFAFGRKRCEYLAEEMTGFDFLSGPEKKGIDGLYTRLCRHFDLQSDSGASDMRPLIKRGIAFHHAGMLPTLKEVIERLFTSGLIKLIFTTETFALGINMPARTVVFDELRKFYGRFYANLKTRDFYQMAGRAGRRGMDTEGFVYSRINPTRLTHDQVIKMIYGPPEKVVSRFNASYATILNLYDRYQEAIYDIYPLSFHWYQQNRPNRKKAVLWIKAKIGLLKDFGYIRRNELTSKGKFASKLYGYELPLTEIYENGLLERLSVPELGILAVALVYEPRKGTARPVLTKGSRKLKTSAEKIILSVQRAEKKRAILPGSKRFHFHLTQCIESWMRDHDFEKMSKLTNADSGEMIRYFRMSVQVLRELLDTPVKGPLRQNLQKAFSLINRDIVDAEKQLRDPLE